MDTPSEIAKDKFIYDHEGECVTCKYYKMRRTIRNGQEYKLEWCENEKSDNYKQLLEDINECEDYKKREEKEADRCLLSLEK